MTELSVANWLGDLLRPAEKSEQPVVIQLPGQPRSAAFTPDGKTLAVGCNDCAIRLYDVASGDLRGEFPGHAHPVAALAFNADVTLLVTSSSGQLRWDRHGSVKLWEAPFPGKEPR